MSQTKLETPSKLIDMVIRELKRSMDEGDLTSLEEILTYVPEDVLKESLGDENQDIYAKKPKYTKEELENYNGDYEGEFV